MKFLIKSICFFIYLMLPQIASAQAPQAFSYQAIARDVNGTLLSNQSVSFRFSILEGSSVGATVYQESHTLTTNQLGLCNVNIGQGTVLNGTFSAINWASGSKFIQVELDPNGGNSFTLMGTTELLSVPYALYANVPGVAGPQGNPGNDGQNGIDGLDGKTILNGTSNPISTLGVDGDFYLNTSTNEIFGPKVAGAWGSGTSLVGPQGPSGTSSGLPNGTVIGNTTFWNGTEWVINDNFLYNDGTQIGIGNPTPSSSSIVDISSTTKGFLIPRMTTTERDAILSPAVGLQIYNLDDNCVDIYNGMVWTKTCGLKITGTVSDPYHPSSDSWAQVASLSGRTNACAFTIGSKAYVGLGNFLGTYFDDFYEYDPSTFTWTQKASFPPGARADATAFSINGKGYVTMGGNGVFVNYDMWEYDPTLDTWTQKSNCPGTARSKAQGFAIDTKGYIGLGNDGTNDLADFWEYDPSVDTWTQLANYPGLGRTHTMGMAINGNGYIGLGTDALGNYYGDIWEYSPGLNTWTAKQTFTGAALHSMASFSMNGKGYMGTGFNGVNEIVDFWEYDAGMDTWTSKAAYSGPARKNAIGFSIGNKGYIATGIGALLMPMDDVWEYMDDNIVGNSYSNTNINTINNVIDNGAWTVYNNNVYSSVNGNVGIGTNTPTSKLTVAGNIDMSGELLANGVSGLAGQVLSSNGNGTMSWITNSGGGGGGSHWTALGNDISNNNAGNVGIGSTPSSDVKLDIYGNGRFIGNLISGISDKGCLSTLTSTGLFTQTLNQLSFDGQRIQASGGINAFPFNPSAKNIYLNPFGGNVGIRTSAASATLTVARGTGGDGTAQFIGTSHSSHFNYSTEEDTYIRGGKNGSKVYINDGALGPVVIGNVSSLPSGYKLFVDDGILTERLRVAVNGSSNWADYVFADDYKLMPLEEVEEYVKEHKHLPNVPSAETMVESGIDVATVDAKLMEKIEELTLYILDLQKQIKELQKLK